MTTVNKLRNSIRIFIARKPGDSCVFVTGPVLQNPLSLFALSLSVALVCNLLNFFSLSLQRLFFL